MSVLTNIISKESFFWIILYFLRISGLWRIVRDEFYLRILYRCSLRQKLNLSCPVSFNEKLNWCKLYDRKLSYSLMADKYEVKKIVEEKIGKEYVIPCFGVWSSVDEIDWDMLPNSFVLKCTHDSGGNFIIKDKVSINKNDLVCQIRKKLSTSYYKFGLEWPYKNIKPRVLAEFLLEDGCENELIDYKWLCFNGEPQVMYITNKGTYGEIYENYYDMDFNPLDINHNFPRRMSEYIKPQEFQKMKQLASILSKGLSFIRIDFFDVNGKIYFGEYTFYDHAGLRPFTSEKWNIILGNMIEL